MAIKKDDILWKGVLEDLFTDFLEFMIPSAENIFDFDRRITFLDKELEQLFPLEGDEYSSKVVDKLAQVYTKEGIALSILVHVEVQGQYNHNFPARMYDYYVRIRSKYQLPVTAFAIFTESSLKSRPDSYREEYIGTGLEYWFNTYKIASQNDEELLASSNLFALVVLVAKIAFAGKSVKDSAERDQVVLEAKRSLARELFSRDISSEKIRLLLNFLRYYVRFENEENNTKFESEIEQIQERNNTMGLEELLLARATHNGKIEGKAEVIENLIMKLGLTDEQAADIAKVSIDFVKKIRASLKRN